MTSKDIQRSIVHALRWGPLDYWQIAVDIQQAPFRVRAELKALARERVVRWTAPRRHCVYDDWELTEVGMAAAWSPQQLGLAV